MTDWPTTDAAEAEWDAVRAAFMNDPDRTYLNTGSFGVMARPVFDAMVAAAAELERDPTRNRRPLEQRVGEARGVLARFVNAPAEDIAFLPNVTVAVNVVVNGIDWREGDEILASDQEYGAINNCLHNAARRWGVTVRRAELPVPPAGPEQVVDAFAAAVTDRTRLLLCSHITTGAGMIAPVKALADLARGHGALSLFDGAHGPGMVPLDLPATGCDFYGGNCHKWLCAPKGVGFLYAAPHAQQRISHLVVSWGYSRDGTTVDDAGRRRIGETPYMWGIEMWGTVALPEQVATAVAVQLQTDIGRGRIAERGRQLAGYLRARMAEQGWAELISPVCPEMSGSISTFRLHAHDRPDLRDVLSERYGITVPVSPNNPLPTIRVSTHLYNTFAHVDRLVAALGELGELRE